MERTRVGLATDCHVETAVEDRRRALVQLSMDLARCLRGGNDEASIELSPIKVYISNSLALECGASGWRGMVQSA